jgi:isopentenyl-diphosphate delta-isomerase
MISFLPPTISDLPDSFKISLKFSPSRYFLGWPALPNTPKALFLLSMKEENVILVNEKDEQLGTMPKMEAHEKAVLHRAFSVFVMNAEGEIMLQQRAAHKYHSPLLWTNTCCSHQRVGESNVAAGKRRLREEMGFTTELKELFSFIYRAPFDNGLTEHELDHVMMGNFNDAPTINPTEVAHWKWMRPEDIKADMEKNPQIYTAWFKIIFEKFYQHMFENNTAK